MKIFVIIISLFLILISSNNFDGNQLEIEEIEIEYCINDQNNTVTNLLSDKIIPNHMFSYSVNMDYLVHISLVKQPPDYS